MMTPRKGSIEKSFETRILDGVKKIGSLLPISNEIYFANNFRKLKKSSALLRVAYPLVWMSVLYGTINSNQDRKREIYNQKQEVLQLENEQYQKEINASFEKYLENFDDTATRNILKRGTTQKEKEINSLEDKKEKILKRENLEGKTGWWSQ